MTANKENLQLISRLTPLAEVQSLIARHVKPVTPRTLDLAAAGGRTLAADLISPARPTAAIALADGWALSADHTIGATGYAPAMLAQMPARINSVSRAAIGPNGPRGGLQTVSARANRVFLRVLQFTRR